MCFSRQWENDFCATSRGQLANCVSKTPKFWSFPLQTIYTQQRTENEARPIGRTVFGTFQSLWLSVINMQLILSIRPIGRVWCFSNGKIYSAFEQKRGCGRPISLFCVLQIAQFVVFLRYWEKTLLRNSTPELKKCQQTELSFGNFKTCSFLRNVNKQRTKILYLVSDELPKTIFPKTQLTERNFSNKKNKTKTIKLLVLVQFRVL